MAVYNSSSDDIQIIGERKVESYIDRRFETLQYNKPVKVVLSTAGYIYPRPGFSEDHLEPQALTAPIQYTEEERSAFPYLFDNNDSYELYANAFSRLGLKNPAEDISSRRDWDAVIASRSLNLRAKICINGLEWAEEDRWLPRSELEQGLRLATLHTDVWVPFGSRFWSSPCDHGSLKWDGDQRNDYYSHGWMILPCNSESGSNEGEHWQLVIYSKQSKTVYYGDSCCSTKTKTANTIAINLRHFLMNNGIDDPGILQAIMIALPLQSGIWQCGYNVIEAARAFVYENGLVNWHDSPLYRGMSRVDRDYALLENIERWSRIGYRDHHDLFDN
ncbi:hypothetical protein F4813DRAFT_386741 [Daldinia decipiens]|uniref:uncharacterized protein n=1 Tax=Daldinia decipiens TaxID=326647 RepID=UPI0020C35D9C|nr:uncharacterized protein F4813DRAFT_386741 [Daldinia decipiens]KAI1660545.1 hypothetical protein F4813DRAFT_386741 [Daldinia decipiens]